MPPVRQFAFRRFVCVPDKNGITHGAASIIKICGQAGELSLDLARAQIYCRLPLRHAAEPGIDCRFLTRGTEQTGNCGAQYAAGEGAYNLCYSSTRTPFQNATKPAIFSAAFFGAG